MNTNWIETVFYQMISLRSDTNTAYETVIEAALLNLLSQHPHFSENSSDYGNCPLPDDPEGRNVIWAMVRGSGSETVVMINHHDAVDIEEYGSLKDLALRPDELKAALLRLSRSEAVLRDASDDRWIFGRGTADMKGGLVSQLGVLDGFAASDDRPGNLLFISVPDEERLSSGMLTAVELLGELRKSHGLKYVLMINSEPYFNQVKDKAIMFEGSVGKIMPVVYVRGVKSHIGDPFAGVNPSLILSEIQKRTELNASLCDIQGMDASPPPVWINLKDRKKAYDASVPEAAVGYFNWLTFSKTPADVLGSMRMISKHALTDVLLRNQQAYETFCMLNHDSPQELDYSSEVLTFGELYRRAVAVGGREFEKSYMQCLEDLKSEFDTGRVALPEAALRLIEHAAEYMSMEGPKVVIGLSGPYYPHITNLIIEDGTRYSLLSRVNRIAQEKFGLVYESKNYFMGISDLSYAGFVGNEEDITVIRENSPGWDDLYRVPFDAMKALAMPVVNIGPWGKDLHKTTERVYGPDVFVRIPEIILELLYEVFQYEQKE